MIAVLNQIDRAAAYAIQSLDAPSAARSIELSAVIHGDTDLGSRSVPRDELSAQIERECRHFPQTTVVIGATREGERYAALQCTCDASIRARCHQHCRHSADRPLLLLLPPSTPAAARPGILAAIQEEVHAYLQSERRKGDAVDNDLLNVDAQRQRQHDARKFREWLERN